MITRVWIKYRVLAAISIMVVITLIIGFNDWTQVDAQVVTPDTPTQYPPPTNSPVIEVINPYFSIEHLTMPDGTPLAKDIINGPPNPPKGYEAAHTDLIELPADAILLPDFPSYNWVFGCSAVSGSMIAGYYDRTGLPNIYTGPTDGGLMPITDTSWPTWSDGDRTYPSNPLVASKNGVDDRVVRGSIDDYWVRYGSTANDPYITNGWSQHSWGTAIGDYMKTSQSAYSNDDGSTSFYNFYSNAKLTCSAMVGYAIQNYDGTYGRKLFYEARGYTVTDCYNQNTDNNYAGGFSLVNFQAEIDSGYPVLLNLAGHSIVGYGYEGSTIYIRDTWDSHPEHIYTMTWGGEYSGMELLSVSIVHPLVSPSAFNKVSPANSATGISTNPMLSWGSSSGATSYEYCYATTTGCTSWTSAGSSTSVGLSGLLNNHTYYWQVRADIGRASCREVF
jgi:hypothetical protein